MQLIQETTDEMDNLSQTTVNHQRPRRFPAPADRRTVFNQLMRGARTQTALFWEVWFHKWAYLRKYYGNPASIEARIQMATDLGIAAWSIGYLDLNVGFGAHQLATTGESRYAGGSLRTRAQLESRPQPDWELLLADLPRKRELVQQAGMAAVLYLPWSFHSIATSMGLEYFSLQLYDNFEFIKSCIQWVENRNREAIQTIVREIQPDLVLFDGDCAFKTGLMIHPHLFRSLVFEETQQTVALLRALQIPYAFHTDGKLNEVLPILIESGFAAIHGCESQANDLAHLVDQFGDQICLVGNMDIAFLTRSQPAEIREVTRQMLTTGLRKGRFIAACNTSPQDDIPDANYLAMIQTIQEYNIT